MSLRESASWRRRSNLWLETLNQSKVKSLKIEVNLST